MSVPENSLPEAFLTRMRATLGADAYTRFIGSYDAQSVRSLLLNRRRGASPGTIPFVLSEAPVPWEPDGFYYEESQRPGKHPLHEAGAYYIQEASAMAPARALFRDLTDPAFAGGQKVLDLCAAPGGKSCQLAMLLGGRGLLIANEIHPARARILSQNIERMGFANTIVCNESPERLAERFAGFFDRILVDAPCSGEGMFRKNPEAIEEWSEEAVAHCAKRQADILEAAAAMLAAGGRMVYSTCTFAPAEDEAQIASFLSRHPAFTLQDEKKLYPHELAGEGHYYAVLTENNAAVAAAAEIKSSAVSRLPQALRREADNLLSGLIPDDTVRSEIREQLSVFGEHLYALPCGSPDLSGLHVLRPGLHVADMKQDRRGCVLTPAHALSHALLPGEVSSCISLNDAEAAAFLNGQALKLSELGNASMVPSDAGPWILMETRGFSLGWAKLAGGMLKNHYPKGLRIPC